ncbi:restriction endonuclease subunit S [Glaesserella parasuis]|uniref:restriction endonuclease subunit S n=1 Tax=Glaesserella parasuis TaxID=738 RepID=UPI0007A06153|nr:restriction endonuclease subunit S [Glaesserella parasuis]AMW16513.1 restriction endonuclease [Glaesserella parasuis]MDG6272506.1 restriction endonuclease subunit S [Glaesserella parasuis]MDG6307625.1 restriction endonuclease subunit S [Glaesserella parasuis]MDG6343779.1 restriction endonuclease subunit S [Glaesserella parasuis]MDG6487215.1 restriction endonuclease subunit S [Glaesserella parasuis]
MQQVKWAEYSCSELFQVVSGSKIKNKSELPEIGNYPVYSSDNNGVVGYTDMPTYICDESRKFYVVFGDHTRTFNIATKSFSILDNVKVLKPLQRVSLRQLLFIISSWKKEIPDLGYARHWKIAKEVKLSLPIKPNANSDKLAQIDFDFMENFISQLEAFRISQLEAYLLVTGLKDYTLTAAEQQALADFENGKVVWGEFKMSDLFERISTRKLNYKAVDLPKEAQGEYVLPCLTSSFQNQGLNYYAPQKGATILKNVISLPSNSDVYRGYYQSREFTVLSDAYAIRWSNKKVPFLSQHYLFSVVCINKVTDLKIYSYKNKLGGWNVVQNKYINYPIKNGEMDYGFMETLISAVQKLVIKDVVRYADIKIAATKQVING